MVYLNISEIVAIVYNITYKDTILIISINYYYYY
jgi:hypothetical protein